MKFIFIVSSTKCSKKCEFCQHHKQAATQRKLESFSDYFIENDTIVLTGYGEPIRQLAIYEFFNSALDYGIISRTAFYNAQLTRRYPTVIIPIFANDQLQRVGKAISDVRAFVPNTGIIMNITCNNDLEYLIRLLPWLVKCNTFLIPNIHNMHSLSSANIDKFLRYAKEYDVVFNNDYIHLTYDIIAEYITKAFEGNIRCSRRFIQSLSMVTIAGNRYIKPCPFLPYIEGTTNSTLLRSGLTNTYKKFCKGCNWFWSYYMNQQFEELHNVNHH